MHRLTEVDDVTRTALCEECAGYVRIHQRSYQRVDGSTHISWICGPNNTSKSGRYQAVRGYRAHKKDYCEGLDCRWVGEFLPEMLDADHIDGDHSNNDPSNIMTLCANCHRTKSRMNKDIGRKPLTWEPYPDIIDI